MADPADTPTYTCAQCASPFQGRKKRYCNQRCAWTAAARRKGQRPLADRKAEDWAKVHRACPECGQTFRITRHDNHSRGPQVHCSAYCWHAEARRQAEVRHRIDREVSILRAWGMGHGRGVESTKYQRWGQRARSACIDCKRPVGPGRTKTFPATRCRECGVVALKRLRRIGKAAREARERTAFVEKFDPLDVLERDGWRCHMCGCKTPKRLRGTYDDRAPELDHVVPLAAGGEHSRRNTACSCRKCNGAKGAKPLGQLRLVA